MSKAKEKCKGLNKNNKPCGNYPLIGKRFCERHQKKRDTKLFLQIVGLIVALSFGSYGIWYNNNLEKDSGILEPPKVSKNEVLVKKFTVGSANFEIEAEDGVWLVDDNVPLIKLKIRDNKLLVSAEIFDDEYKKVSYISDNEWHVNQNNCERNYTDNIVEVKNQRGEVVIQAIHFGNTVHLAFQLYSRNGWRMTLMPEYYVFDNYKGETLTELFNKTSVFRYGKRFIPVDKQLVFEDKIEVIKQAHPFIGAVWSLEPSSFLPRYSIPSICDYPRDLSPEKCDGEKIVDLFIDANGALFSTSEALTMRDYQSIKGDRPLYIVVSGMLGEFLSEEQKRLEADNYRN